MTKRNFTVFLDYTYYRFFSVGEPVNRVWNKMTDTYTKRPSVSHTECLALTIPVWIDSKFFFFFFCSHFSRLTHRKIKITNDFVGNIKRLWWTGSSLNLRAVSFVEMSRLFNKINYYRILYDRWTSTVSGIETILFIKTNLKRNDLNVRVGHVRAWVVHAYERKTQKIRRGFELSSV